MMHWILDGYNIILADEKLARLARNHLEAGREELVREILSSGKFRGKEDILMVFDGRSGGSTEEFAPNLMVKFSRRGETADDLIKNTLANYKKRNSIFVVSSDHSIMNYSKECGAKSISSREFLSSIRLKKKKRNENDYSSEKPTTSSKSDLELLRLFKERKHET